MAGVSAAVAAAEARLDESLRAAGSLVVAFSGGVDSSYLALRAHRVLGGRALAVTADSASLPRAQRARAEDLAASFGFAHRVIATREVEDPRYARNDALRCYHCKTELFTRLLPLARDEGYALFERARTAFAAGDARQALDLTEQAIGKVPDDPVLHEFGALSLFALGGSGGSELGRTRRPPHLRGGRRHVWTERHRESARHPEDVT